MIRLNCEVLESRVVLTAQNLDVIPEYTCPDPPVPQVPAEVEPNDTLEQANLIELQDGWPPMVYAFDRVPCYFPDDAAGVFRKADTDFIRPVRPDYRYGEIHGELPISIATEDVDYFTFDAAAERKISLYVHGGAIENGATVELLDAQGNLLATAEGYEWDSSSVYLNYYSRAGGTFFVRIGGAASPENADDNSYDLLAEVYPDPYSEHEPNDSTADANPIQLEQSYAYWLDARPRMAIINPDLWDGWGRNRGETGYISGEIEQDVDRQDNDFFSVTVAADRDLNVELHGSLAHHGGQLRLLDEQGNVLAEDLDASDGLALKWSAPQGGTFFIQVSQAPQDDGDENSTGEGHDNGSWSDDWTEYEYKEEGGYYSLSVHATPIPNEVEGPDETEPNNSLDQANELYFNELPIFGPWLDFRTAQAHGIAAGTGDDQDYFRFDVQAGERVFVGISSLIRHHGGDLFDSLGDYLQEHPLRSRAGFGPRLNGHDFIGRHLPDVTAAPVQVIVLDAAGNEVGRSTADLEHPDGVDFTAEADGTYYAVVSIAQNDLDRPVHYRLGVLAQGEFELPDPGDPGNGDGEDDDDLVDDEPCIMELENGDTYTYTDSSGDEVELRFRGRHATVTFTGDEADGSDIESIIVDGGRKGGALVVDSAGDAEIGSIEINGFRGRRRVINFNRVDVDGNLGELVSDTNLKRVTVDGILGDVQAPGRRIARLVAQVFDEESAVVGAIANLDVEHDMVDAIFERFMPWENQPETPNILPGDNGQLPEDPRLAGGPVVAGEVEGPALGDVLDHLPPGLANVLSQPFHFSHGLAG
jgi:hypothetical protein